MKAFKWEIPKTAHKPFTLKEELECLGKMMTMPRKSDPGEEWVLVEMDGGYTMELRGSNGIAKAWMHPDDYDAIMVALDKLKAPRS